MDRKQALGQINWVSGRLSAGYVDMND